jgi:hypothetical protein
MCDIPVHIFIYIPDILLRFEHFGGLCWKKLQKTSKNLKKNLNAAAAASQLPETQPPPMQIAKHRNAALHAPAVAPDTPGNPLAASTAIPSKLLTKFVGQPHLGSAQNATVKIVQKFQILIMHLVPQP